MAAVDVVMPAPPPPAPVARISRLALAAADAVVFLWIASLWVFHASLARAIIVFLACGPGWGCTGAAWTAVLVSLLFFLVVCPLAALLLSKFVEPFYTNQLQKGAAALEPISEAVIKAHFIAITVFFCIQALGFLLKILAPKDPPTEKFVSVIMLMPLFGLCLMCCLVSIPGFAVRVWRMRRHSSASVVPI